METFGITREDESINNTVWEILGQTYTLKQVTESSMAWHGHFPSGTFVPPHVHYTQEEYLYVLSGQYNIWFDGEESLANPGDMVRMPRNIPHGIFNNSESEATCLFWVAPTSELEQLFNRINKLKDPQEIERIAEEHQLRFLAENER